MDLRLFVLAALSFGFQISGAVHVDGGREEDDEDKAPRCCCKEGGCDDSEGWGEEVTEVVAADQPDPNVQKLYCCRPVTWNVRARFTGKCDWHHPLFSHEAPLQDPVDENCKISCSENECHGNGEASPVANTNFLTQGCECKCFLGYDPETECATKLDENAPKTQDFLPNQGPPTLKYTAKKMVTAEFAHCEIESVQLHFKPIGPNPLLPQWAIEKTQQKLMDEGNLPFPGNFMAMAHCGLKLNLGGEKCPEKVKGTGLLLEHNEVLNAKEWDGSISKMFYPIASFNTTDLTGLQTRQTNAAFDSTSRGPTVFEAMYEMFSRDPNLQDYSITTKNCCDFAWAAGEVLLTPDDHKKFQEHLQDGKKMGAALQSVYKKATMAFKLVRLVGWLTGSTPNFQKINSEAVDFFDKVPLHAKSMKPPLDNL